MPIRPQLLRRARQAIVALVAVVLVVSAGAGVRVTAARAATATATATATAVAGPPSWWDGDCDANHWNAAAAAQGWTGAGAHRLGAVFAGVPVCGPRHSADGAPDVQWTKPGWGHFEWECTELVFRFMAQLYGVTAYGANGNTVVANYRQQYGGGLQTVDNGTPGVAPAPGDVMSFDAPNGFGHAAVVTASTVDANGNGQITLMSQNDTADGWRTLTVVAWSVQPFGSETPTAWLHDPLGRASTPTGKTWYLRNTLTTGVADASFVFGAPGDQTLACDWNGDGIDTAATFRGGWWYLLDSNSSDAKVTSFPFGAPGDRAICGDWNGDGIDTVGVYRNGWFYLHDSNSSGYAETAFPYGNPNDNPIVGDWDGSGTDTVGVTRDGRFYLRNSNTSGYADVAFFYGAPTDGALVGDWNGDHVDTVGIWRDGALYLTNTNWSGFADYVFRYGNPGDAPVIGDWSNGSTDVLGVVRDPS